METMKGLLCVMDGCDDLGIVIPVTGYMPEDWNAPVEGYLLIPGWESSPNFKPAFFKMGQNPELEGRIQKFQRWLDASSK